MPSLPPLSVGQYGADEAGLICAYRLQPGGGTPAQSLDAESAAQWLAQGPEVAAPDEAFLWLHLNLSHAQAERWLRRHAPLPDEFFEALHDGMHSTRLERVDDVLLAVVNDLQFDFSFEPSDLSTLWIAVGPRLVVTARTKPLRSVDTLRIAIRSGDVPGSTTALLEHLMRAQADALVQIIRTVSARIDTVEDRLLEGRLDPQRRRLGELRRVLVRLQRLLAPEPAALFRLLQQPPAWMAADDAQGLRDASEEFSVVLRDMSGLQERIKLLQEEIAANVQEGNNRSLFVLTIVTVLALPINILAGLFGMNVGGIPLAEHPHGFWIVVALVAGITAVAAWVAFRQPPNVAPRRAPRERRGKAAESSAER